MASDLDFLWTIRYTKTKGDTPKYPSAQFSYRSKLRPYPAAFNAILTEVCTKFAEEELQQGESLQIQDIVNNGHYYYADEQVDIDPMRRRHARRLGKNPKARMAALLAEKPEGPTGRLTTPTSTTTPRNHA